MVLRVGAAARAPTLTLPPGVALAQARAFLADHEGWLRRQLAGHTAKSPVGDGSVLPFSGGSLTIRHEPGRRLLRSGDVLAVGGSHQTIGPRVAAWLREEARAACVAGSLRHAASLGLRARPGRAPRPAVALGVLHRDRRSDVLLAADHGAGGGPRLRDRPRGRPSRRAQPLAAFLGRGPAALSRAWTAEREWLRRHGATLHRHDFAAATGAPG